MEGILASGKDDQIRLLQLIRIFGKNQGQSFNLLEGDKRLVRRDYHGMNEFEGLKFNAYEIHLGRSEFEGKIPESLVYEDPNLGVLDSSNRPVG